MGFNATFLNFFVLLVQLLVDKVYLRRTQLNEKLLTQKLVLRAKDPITANSCTQNQNFTVVFKLKNKNKVL